MLTLSNTVIDQTTRPVPPSIHIDAKSATRVCAGAERRCGTTSARRPLYSRVATRNSVKNVGLALLLPGEGVRAIRIRAIIPHLQLLRATLESARLCDNTTAFFDHVDPIRRWQFQGLFLPRRPMNLNRACLDGISQTKVQATIV